MEKSKKNIKVYCWICGAELKQVYITGEVPKKIRVYPCGNKECHSNKNSSPDTR